MTPMITDNREVETRYKTKLSCVENLILFCIAGMILFILVYLVFPEFAAWIQGWIQGWIR